MREYLSFPHPNTIRNFFGDIDIPGELHERENIIKTVLTNDR